MHRLLVDRSRSLRSADDSCMMRERYSRDAGVSWLSRRHSSSSRTTLPCSPMYRIDSINAFASSMNPSSDNVLLDTSSSTTGSRRAARAPCAGGTRFVLEMSEWNLEPRILHTRSLAHTCPNFRPSLFRYNDGVQRDINHSWGIRKPTFV